MTPSLIIGFTGTRAGISAKREDELRRLLTWLAPQIKEVHHGDCVGADAQFDQLCAELKIRRHGWPCVITSKRAYCTVEVVHAVMKPFVRNKLIVDKANLLIATPTGPEVLRSGTWSTVRYAKTQGKAVIFV